MPSCILIFTAIAATVRELVHSRMQSYYGTRYTKFKWFNSPAIKNSVIKLHILQQFSYKLIFLVIFQTTHPSASNFLCTFQGPTGIQCTFENNNLLLRNFLCISHIQHIFSTTPFMENILVHTVSGTTHQHVQ